MKNVKLSVARHLYLAQVREENCYQLTLSSGPQIIRYSLIAVILIISTTLKAQFPDTLMKATDTSFFQITSKVDTYLNNLDDSSFALIGASDEDGWIPNYYRWKHFWQNRVDENGMFETAYKKMLNIVNGVWSSCNYSNLDEDKQWKCLGPFNSEGTHSEQDQNQGQVTAISVNASNSSDILVGTSGGVFRSTNGGVSWVNTTDDEGYSVFTITSFARHPLNQNIIYATTGTGIATWNLNMNAYGRNYGIGLIVSQDGGITWYKSNIDISPPLEYFDRTCTKVLIDPTSTLGNTKLYMMQNMKIYKMNGLAYCNNYLSVWTDMTTPDDLSGVLWGWTNDLYGLGGRQRSYNDMEIESNGTLWFSNIEGLYKYDPGTTSTTKVTNYIPASVLTGSITCAISGGPVTKANPVYHSIYMDINRQDHIVFWDEFTVATSCTTNIVVRKLFRSTDHGTSWQTSTGYGGDINKFFVLSPYNSNIIYTEQKDATYAIQVHKIGADADLNYSPLTPDMILSTNHTDVRALIIAPESPNIAASNPTGSSDILYVGNDGGVSKTVNGLNWTIKNGYGLAISQYYGLGITEQDKDFMYAGAQDGSIGNFYHGKYFNEDRGGDNGDCIIDATNDPANVNKIVYQESWNWWDRLDLPTFRTDYNVNSNEIDAATTITPPGSDDIDDIAVTLEQNPFQPKQIAGGYQQVYLTEDKGATWNPSYTNTAIHPDRVSISSICFSGINSFYYSIFDIGGSGGIYSVPDKSITSGIVEISNNLKSGSLSIGNLAPITDITVDPANTQRIWITFGGFIANSKVYHSENGGLSWTNISGNGCLPNIPFSSICYQEGSNDRIYVGTDIGVFFRDNSMADGRWDFYGIGGPRNLISDMDINDCGQKLVCTTMGRGLWEVPLIPNPELVISANNTWSISGIKNMYTDIHITRGAGGASTTLKILAGTLNMAEGRKIIIDKGCKLLVKDATITNGCNTMWEGIKVDGAGSGQDLSGPDNLTNISCNQGYIYLENATISNAHNAISTINSPTTTICSGLYDASGMFGGIVRAVNTTFRNNGRSAEFLMLRSFPPPPMLEPNNLSYFQSCTFTIDDNYPSENPFYAHVTMWNTYGISFTGCSFNNLKTTVVETGGLSAAELLGKGIYSIDAHYSVTLSAFESLTNGISVDNSSSGTVNIFKNGFIDNLYGLRLNTSNNSIIRNNTFAVGTIDVPSSPHPTPVGSSFISSSKYTMNNNIYSGSGDISIGSWFSNNGGDDNLCITNKYQSLKYANLTNYKNRVVTTSGTVTGLVFRCNKNIQNYRDFTSYSTYSYPSDGYGIKDNQGTLTQFAGNTFSTPPSIDMYAHFQQSDWNHVNYVLPASTTTIYEPVATKCNIGPRFSLIRATISTSTCPIPLIDPWTGGGGAHKRELEVYAGEDIEKMSSVTRDSTEADFLMHKNDYQYYSLQLKNLIDGGNTELLKEDIQNSSETAELRAKLLDQSPYMSTDALKEAIDKSGILPDAILFEILAANPDAIRDAVLLDYLEKKPEPLPSWMLEYLKENMATVTARTLLDYAVSEAHEKMMLSARAILHDIQFNPEGLDHVALRYWLGQLMDKEADYMIADDYIEAGNYENAKTIIEAIPVLYKLSESEHSEHLSSLDLLNWKITVLKDGSKSIARLNEVEKADLAKIAETGKGVAKYKAENILNYFYDGKYIHLPELPDETSGKRDLTTNTIEKDIASYIKVYPNPAKDLTTFEYQLPCISHEGILTITDITGKIIYMNNKLIGEHNILNLDTKEWQSGNYLYKLVCDGVNIGEGKLSIIK